MNIDILNKPIVFVGMMGCGKSYIGQALAKDLGINFYDSDKLIEEQEGKSISRIFAESGEKKFRNIEKDVILDLLDKSMLCVISTGGGAVTSFEVLDSIKNKSISIWLQSDVNSIYSRLIGDKTRPLLQCDDPISQLKKLLDKRYDLYSKADLIVKNDSSFENVVSDIKLKLYKFLEGDF